MTLIDPILEFTLEIIFLRLNTKQYRERRGVNIQKIFVLVSVKKKSWSRGIVALKWSQVKF